MRKERSKKVNIRIYIAALLLCAALLSIHLAGGLLAGFSKTENGSDSARVAEFNITQEGTFFETMEIAVKPGTSQSQAISIKNNSEVSVECTLEVNRGQENLPKELAFSLKPEGVTKSGTSESDKCLIPPNDSKKYVLEVEWPQESEEDEKNNLEFMGKVDSVTVSVTAVQID